MYHLIEHLETWETYRKLISFVDDQDILFVVFPKKGSRALDHFYKETYLMHKHLDALHSPRRVVLPRILVAGLPNAHSAYSFLDNFDYDMVSIEGFKTVLKQMHINLVKKKLKE